MITGLCMLAIGSLNEILTLFCMVTSLFLYIEIFKGRFEIAKYFIFIRKEGIMMREIEGIKRVIVKSGFIFFM